MKNKLIAELEWRGILNNATNEAKLDYAMQNHKGAYIGFDPSAKSLHLGNYAAIMLLRHFKTFGLRTIGVVGGATGMIGDPSGKKAERKLLNVEIINENKKHIREQLIKYAHVDEIVDNYDHYKDMSFLDFLREIGKYMNVNYMLEKDIIKSRLETGISYTEFTYTLIQGYDFVKLYKEKDVYVQAGGSDQWGNITTGCEMIRRMVDENNNASGITVNLLLNADGNKFGKSEKGAIFLDPEVTSPYEMYQFLINQEDNIVINLLKFLTQLDHKTITDAEASLKAAPRDKVAQKLLAKTIIEDIHGANVYADVIKISDALFSGDLKKLSLPEIKQTFNSIPSVELDNGEHTLVEFLVKTEIAKSNREARELIDNNSIMLNGEKTNDQNLLVSNRNTLHPGYTFVKKGKRNYFLIHWH